MDVGTYAQLQQIQRARLARAKQRPASAPVEPKPRPLRPVNNDGAAGGAAYLPKHKDVATAGPRPKPAVPKIRGERVSRKKPVPSRVDFAKRPAGDEDEPYAAARELVCELDSEAGGGAGDKGGARSGDGFGRHRQSGSGKREAGTGAG